MLGHSDERIRSYLDLYALHQDHDRPCTYVPVDEFPKCPCFPYDSASSETVDDCPFAGVNRCSRHTAHLEQVWCGLGADLALAISLRLV